MLDRDSVLKAQDIPAPEKVEVPEWGGCIYVRIMTGTERDEFEASSIQIVGKGKHRTVSPDMRNARAKLLVRCLCDESGKRLFNDQDIVALGKKNSGVLDRLFERTQALNGIRDQDLDELEKYSQPPGTDILAPAVDGIPDADPNFTTAN